MTTPPRVVLDTNVVLSALVFTNSRLVPLRHAWQAGRCQPLVSAATTSELMRALGYPEFKLSKEDQQELLADYLPYCSAIRIQNKPQKIPACRDPEDRPFLELALAGKADYLVSGDKDVQSMAAGFRCPIMTAGAFLAILGPL